ncbi:MAG: glutamate decarboxylase [Bacillota bacterium]|nr:MAG: glutamate decarboxylase [Bacillota bacterium]
MWKVIYVASSQEVAARLRDALAREGLLVRLRPVGGTEGSGPVEILVPRAEARDAYEVLTEILGRTRPPRL